MHSATLTSLLTMFGGIAKRCLLLVVVLCASACSVDAPGADAEARVLQEATTAIHRVNCGGGAVSPFTADQFASGGMVWTDNGAVSTAGVLNAAPASVYQSERFGTHSYTFGGLTPGAAYVARLHFAETYLSSAGQRVFNVSINGTQVLTNFDIFATAGGRKAIVFDFNTTASSSGQITIQYISVVNSAKSSAIEILSITNQNPTVSTAAAANPQTTFGTTTSLGVLGADDGGEANLTYTWATTGTPPAPVSFSANAINAAKNTTATFTKAGSYALSVTIRDASGATVTSNVNVVVNQQLSSISVTPASAQVATGATQQFSASAKDQFNQAMTPQPAVSWATSGGGSINSNGLFAAGAPGTFSVTATSGIKTGTASVTVSSSGSGGGAMYRVNCGGGAVSPFTADQFASGGMVWTDNGAVSTAGVLNAAPASVYQSERFGTHSYTFGGLTPGAAYVARLHFAETYLSSAGQRVFNVSINGTQVLTNFDIFATAGGRKAIVFDFNTTASSSGQITIQYISVVNSAKSSAIEILSITNQNPTVSTAAAANPQTTFGTTTSLGVLGADDGGEANLTYTWATTGTPPAPVSFSANAINAAKNTTATFTKAGSYALSVTIRDASGATVTSNVNVVVNQQLSSISVTPASAQVATGGRQQFFASALDQFGNAMALQPSISWTVSGGGTVDSAGSFTAGSTGGGPFTVRATSGAVNGSANVTVTAGGGTVSYTTDFGLNESPISQGGAWRQNGLDWTRVVTANGLAFGTQTGHAGFDDSYAYLSASFPANQSATAIIHLEPGVLPYAEVEILLRWRDTDHTSTGYECNLAFNGQYAEIIRWPGPRGTQISQYTYVARGAAPEGVRDGDVFQADVIGNVITTRLNGRVLASGTDTAIPSGGAPGIGFFWDGSPASQKYSFTHFSATGL